MRNIISIFLSDMRRVFSNVVAVVIVMGLSVIPCLYAWFNIFSNWAPYEEDATRNLQVAVASEDEGADIRDENVNIGDIVISNIKSNTSIHWIFLDNGYDAIEGVKKGEYYAAFVVDKDFSKNMISFIEGDVRHPEIQYYENDKKNAIAPKITGKVRTTLQEGIGHAFVETLAKSFLSISAGLESEELKSKADEKAAGIFDRTNEDLDAVVSVIDAYIDLYDTALNAADAADAVSDEIDTMNGNIEKAKDSTHLAIENAAKSIDSLDDLVDINLSQVKTDLALIDQKAELLYKAADTGSSKANARLDTVKTLLDTEQVRFDTIRTDIKKLGVPVSSSVSTNADKVDESFTALSKDISELEKYNTALPKDAKKFYNACKNDIKKCGEAIDKLKRAYKNDVSPVIDSAVSSVKSKSDDALKELKVSEKNINRLVAILDGYPEMMSFGPEKLKSAKKNILEIKARLNTLEKKYGKFSSAGQYAMFMELLKTDPEEMAEFLTSPVSVKTEQLYPYENNGSAMAPFYIVLSIWVGALILVAITHTRVKKGAIEKNFNHVEEFFGRYLFFFLIGQLQTFITVLGALLFVQIQCEHPFLLWASMSLTSFCFTLLLYSLVFAFDAVGEALAVVMMVLQVAGSGGTFPVEVLPNVYNVMYKYMPFVYSTNAAKESIAGMYKDYYYDNLKTLLIYVAVSLVIGLIVSVPFKKFVSVIKESTEKTDLII